MKQVIKFCNVSIGYAGNAVLHNISFEINEHEQVLLVGDNGTGKSTLLKAIFDPSLILSGATLISNHAVSKAAYLPQLGNYNLPPLITGSQLLESSALTSVEWGRIDEVISGLQLKSFVTSPVAAMSGGQRQAIFCATILIKEFNLLVLDEPCCSLDVEIQHNLVNFLHQQHQIYPFTLLVTTHNPRYFQEYCTKTINLNLWI